MRLNYDCVRDVLLTLEQLLQIKYDNGSFAFSNVDIERLYKSMPTDYSIKDTLYSVLNLKEAGYIKASLNYGDGKLTNCFINKITYSGNEFLDKVRPKTRWEKIKEAIKKIGTVTIPLISEISTSIVTSAIKTEFGLPE